MIFATFPKNIISLYLILDYMGCHIENYFNVRFKFISKSISQLPYNSVLSFIVTSNVLSTKEGCNKVEVE